MTAAKQSSEGDQTGARQLDALHWDEGQQLTPGVALALAERVQRDRRYRDSAGLFFVEGVRNFVTAVEHGLPINAIIYSERLLTAPFARKLVRQLKRAGTPFAQVSPEQFRRISQAESASGVAAILQQQLRSLEQVTPSGTLCWILLDHVRSPGNLGTLIRSSTAAGGAGFLLLDQTIDPFDPAIVRASMGSIFRQTFVRTQAMQLRRWIHQHELQVVGASPEASLAYDELDYRSPTLLVLGTERSGLSPEQRSLCQYFVRIPMVEGIDSINLGVAGSLLIYEVLRAARRFAL